MPTPTTVKLLLDEGGHSADNNELSNWAQSVERRESTPRPPRRSSGTAAFIAVAVIMLLLGLVLGGFLYTLIFPDCAPLFPFRYSNDTSGESSEREDGVAEELQGCEDDFPWEELRLPQTVRPTDYNLTLHPNLTTGDLNGNVVIELEIMNETQLIVLHAARLNLSSFVLTVNGKKINADFSECSRHSQWAFETSRRLKPRDDVILIIEFTGKVLADLQGFYISTHTTADGKKWRSAVTQFEPAHARRAFPCFDEPNFKAVFTVSVIREPKHVVRSNAVLNSSHEHVDGLYIDIFEPSLRMSTYLLAIAVLENYAFVKQINKATKEQIEVRIYAPKDVIKNQTDFGMDVAMRSLVFFENYFNISYPLKKQDLLALDDFSEGAMENWGLVTFRDSALLFNEASSSVLNKEHIALVICHEIAHQWFGNLVTMDWWKDIWLNEGFANFMEYKCVDHLFPDWNIMTRFYAENVAYSMDPDGLASSRPISGSSSSSDSNIMSLFDAISYHKAAAIIHMLSGLAGEVNFRRALIEYLNKYAYQNAKGSQLWKIVEKVGYPVISVQLSPERDELIVHNQTRFFFEEGRKDENDSEWPLPVQFRTDETNQTTLRWLKKGERRVTWPLGDSVKWIIVNTNGLGYFKVLYDRKMYNELIHQLDTDHLRISAIDRAMLLTDTFDFTKSGHVDIGTYMKMLLYTDAENDRMTWSLVNKQLMHIEALIEDTHFAHLFQDLQRSLVLRIYEKFHWKKLGEHKSPTDRGLHAEILAMACRLRHGDCPRKAQQKFNEWYRERSSVPSELHFLVTEEGVRQGDAAVWEKVKAEYQKASAPAEKVQLLVALTETRDMKLINKFLRMCLDTNLVRPNILPRALASLATNEVARPHSWRFFKINYDRIAAILGDGSNLLLASVRSMVDKFSTEHDLEDVREFLADKKLESTQPAKVDQIYEQIKLNIQWRRLNEAGLKDFLQDWDEKRRTTQRKKHRLI